MNKDGVYRISNTHNMLVVVGCNRGTLLLKTYPMV
jgi:hypothetical protein